MCMQKQVQLHEITPSWIGKQKALQRFKAPTSEEKWKEYGIDVRWGLTWAIKPKYASPRDIVVWLQLQHRTLWVAKNGGCADDKCTARGCNAIENMTHLVDCGVIQKEFWTPILRIMIGLGLQYERSRTFWIAGLIVGEDNERKAVCGETASFLCWAWRCLYAEIIGIGIGRNSPQRLIYIPGPARTATGWRQRGGLCWTEMVEGGRWCEAEIKEVLVDGRVENPRWTARWRGVLRRAPRRATPGPPCVPLALSGYGYELCSCTSTARRPYGIPARAVWYCILIQYALKSQLSARGRERVPSTVARLARRLYSYGTDYLQAPKPQNPGYVSVK